jgi:DNA-binding CsgD family transcriptional regulator
MLRAHCAPNVKVSESVVDRRCSSEVLTSLRLCLESPLLSLDTPHTALPSATIREIPSGNTLRMPTTDLVQRTSKNDEWTRHQGAMDFAASLLSVASSYTPEVFRCLSQLILSTLQQTSEPANPSSVSSGSDHSLKPGSIASLRTVTPVSQKPAIEATPCSTRKDRSTAQSPIALRVPDSEVQQRQRNVGASQARAELTASEKRVAELVSQGLSLKQAAVQLFISAKTVEFHLQSVYRKLDVHNRGEFATVFFTLQNAA